MKNLKLTCLCFLICVSFNLSAQTETQIINEINSRGIKTMTDVNAELAKRGLTEAEARKMAKLYGLDYDQYISKYISTDNDAYSVSELNEIDSVNSKLSYTTISSEIKDTIVEANTSNALPYFGYDIFENNPFANKDYLIGNIDENYILGPGDEIRLYVWGYPFIYPSRK